jgi:opacity protein-like surface antigen
MHLKGLIPARQKNMFFAVKLHKHFTRQLVQYPQFSTLLRWHLCQQQHFCREIIMKKIALGLLLVASPALLANPYLGLSYQHLNPNLQRSDASIQIGGRTLDLNQQGSRGSAALLLGYQLTPAWALEVSGWQQEGGDSVENRLSAQQDEEWEAELDGRHLNLAAVWQQQLSAALNYSLSAGLLYSRYDIRASHSLDNEDAQDVVLAASKQQQSELGFSVAAHLTMQLDPQWSVRAGYRYQQDSLLRSHGPVLSAVYHF